MKWETNTRRVPPDRHRARCGHLYVRIDMLEGDGEDPNHPDYEPPTCEWFVEPDDDDKSYRRALVEGVAPTVDAAKAAAVSACEAIIAEMTAALGAQ